MTRSTSTNLPWNFHRHSENFVSLKSNSPSMAGTSFSRQGRRFPWPGLRRVQLPNSWSTGGQLALPILQARSETDALHMFRTWLSRMLILAPMPSQISGRSRGDALLPNREVTNFGEWFSGVLAISQRPTRRSTRI